ncbi:MAG: hypothetical protein JXR51_04640 [Bacteroidales bacterium]|nr:hypothetical protein [Bacteroidales bacterium]MBN2756445.1 hypothetical protein [Bacteroidales bacterium]
MEKLISESIKIHDKFSFEIKLGYSSDSEIKSPEYSINMYMFVPNSLDINTSTYEKREFYHDLKSNIRLMTPVFLLRDIYLSDNSPFKRLEKSFYELSKKPNKENIENYEFQIKMFSSVVKSAVRREVFHIKNNKIDEDINFLIREYIQKITEILEKYRSLRRIINVPTIDTKFFNIYLFGDEYLGNLIEKYTFRLLRFLRTKTYKAELKIRLIDLIKSEIEYKKVKNLPVATDNYNNNEELLYRRSVLKKFIESKLFLNTRVKEEGKLAEQIIYSIAAGIAMIFATGIAFYTQKEYGNFTIPLFIALVFSYMLKDRIKELARIYFSGRYRKNKFDHKRKIYSGKNNNVGYCRESFSYISEENIPKSISKRRNRSHLTEIENNWLGETTILYKKHIKIYGKELKSVYKKYKITGINDIATFNISKFLEKMSNPEIPMYILDEKSYKKIYGNKVYHLNIIIYYKTPNNEFYKRYRVVLNRNGILGIDKVMVESKN